MTTDKTDTPRLSTEVVVRWLDGFHADRLAIGQNLAADLLDARRELEAARARVAALEGLADILSGTLEAHTDRRRQDLQTLAAEREAHAALRARIEGLAKELEKRAEGLTAGASRVGGGYAAGRQDCLRGVASRLALLTPDPEPSTGGGS